MDEHGEVANPLLFFILHRKKEPYINANYTGESTNDVIESAIQKETLTILSAFAEKERIDIKQRHAEGIALAKK
ncbi:hypothetical protein IKA_05200 [Bacillus cereus VD169]|nr:hypothetical protein IKA_05200 [Bacillus cereus VD169]